MLQMAEWHGDKTVKSLEENCDNLKEFCEEFNDCDAYKG
jgi:hypothetical protein